MLTPLFPTPLPTRTETLPNGYSFRMLRIPEGRFEMGNYGDELWPISATASPLRKMTVAAFELAEFTVTQALWEAVRLLSHAKNENTLALPKNPSFFRGLRRPVERVNWHEAEFFCQLLTQLIQRKYRLPTESEWEYAATCGRRAKNFAGGSDLNEVGWYMGNNNKESMPVGLLAPNDWGLYDMSGNVDEWCADHWHESYRGAPQDSSAWQSEGKSTERVYRGGSWNFIADSCSPTIRGNGEADHRISAVGFRLAASID